MPFAPSPIQIRYGGPGQLGALAAASGQAEYNNNQGQRDYSHWLNRRAMDQELIASIRASQDAAANDKYREEAALSQPSPFRLQQAYAPRMAAQRTGSLMSGAGRAKTPLELQMEQEKLDSTNLSQEGAGLRNERLRRKLEAPQMVPVTGAIDQPSRGSMSMTVHPQDGEMGPPATFTQADLPSGGANTTTDMVPLQVRRSMDAIDALPHLDADSKTAIKMAIRNGLPAQQAFIEARALMPKSEPKSPIEKAADKSRIVVMGIDAATQQGPEAAKRFLMALYPNDYTLPRLKGDAVMQALAQERARHAAFVDSAGQQQAPQGARPGSGPAPGTVMDGHRFKGGNPADAASWEPVQ